MNQESELDHLIKRAPSILGNSIGILIVRVLAWVLACLFFSSGVYFIFMAIIGNSSCELLLEVLDNSKVDPLLAALCLLLSMLLFFIVKLGKMLLIRNAFILEIKEWNEKLKAKNDQPKNTQQ